MNDSMEVFSSIRSVFGNIEVKQTEKKIVVSGIRAGDIIRDINKFWKTTKITQNLFDTVSNRSFTFDKFFAPEVMYMLENIKYYRNRYTTIKAINSIREAMMENTWLKNTVPVDPKTTPGRLDFSRLKNMTFTPEPYQLEYFENYTYRLDQYGLNGDLIAAAPGTGKAISMDANIKVLGGWKKMRDIQVGDNVTAWDGTQTKVVGVFPQGMVNNFTVSFNDGRRIDACENHQWRVYCKDWKRRGDGWKILTTRELFGYYNTTTYKNRLYIQLCLSEDSPELNYTVEPYTLGFNLGSITVDSSGIKFIPDEYLNGSMSQRWALLQGLMDASGNVEKNSSLSYHTSSKKLSENIQYLVRSLGGVAKVDIGKTKYRINIRVPKPSMAFRLENKLKHCIDDSQYTGDSLKLKVTGVTATTSAEAQCISVAHPDHLFITDDFIVTHNTYMTSAIAEMVSAEMIFVFCPMPAVNTVWLDSIKEMYKEPQTVWNSISSGAYAGERWVVCHYDQLSKAADIVREVSNWKGKKVVTILDESHNFNDPNSLRSTVYLGICKALGSNNNLQASGTPVKAIGAEIITLLRTVDPLFTPDVEVRLKKMFGRDASKGLDIIKHRLGLVSFKIEKKELKLKPPIISQYPIKIPNGERFTLPAIRVVMLEFIKEREKYYRERLPEDLKFWDKCVMLARSKLVSREDKVQFDEYLHTVHMISKTPDPRYLGQEMKAANSYEKNTFEKYLPRDMIERFRDVKSVIKYVRLKIQGEALGRIIGGMRIEAHVAMIPYIDWIGLTENTEKKTIAFTTFVECVEETERVTSKLGLHPATVYGKNSNELEGTVKRYDTDPNLNPLIATYATLSTAVRLTMADTMILIDSPVRGYILEQAISRIYRIGQDSQTYVYQCTLDTGDIPNISTRSADILQWSQQQVEAIMGIKSPLIEGDTYGLESVEGSPDNYSDEEWLYKRLSAMYDITGIEINKADFQKPKRTVPAYLR